MIEMDLNPKAKKFKRSELPRKYIARILFRWDDRKFEEEYLKKLERNQVRQKEKKEETSSFEDKT